MFIKARIKKLELNRQVDHSVHCESCNYQGVVISIVRYQLELFWIPFIAFPKDLKITCLNCSKKVKMKSLRDTQQIRVKNLMIETKAPLWQFTGLFILTAVILLAILIAPFL